MKRRILAGVLLIAMLMAALPIAAFAMEDETPSDEEIVEEGIEEEIVEEEEEVVLLMGGLRGDPVVVTIEDPVLRKGINAALGQAEDATITDQQLASLTRLSMNIQPWTRDKIQSLAGLEHAVNLEYLYINNHDVSDISVVEHMPKLKFVTVNGNKLTNLNGFTSAHTALTYLEAAKNEISDISALSGATSLKTLKLSENNISDISPYRD